MPGELTDDDPIVNRLKRFEVTVYNVIMDSVLSEFYKPFSKHEYLYKSLELLDPSNFKAIIHEELKKIRFEGILKHTYNRCLKTQIELSQFVREWPTLKNPIFLSDIQDNNHYLDDGDEDENDSDQGPKHKR